MLPPFVEVIDGTEWFPVLDVNGTTDCCSQTPATPADGGSKFNTGVNGFEGISGVSGAGEMFLVGVLLGDGEPAGTPPAAPPPLSAARRTQRVSLPIWGKCSSSVTERPTG